MAGVAGDTTLLCHPQPASQRHAVAGTLQNTPFPSGCPVRFCIIAVSQLAVRGSFTLVCGLCAV